MDCIGWMNSIVNTVCAIATVAAVIVALWQTKYSNRKKLKLRMSTAFIMVQNGDGTLSDKAWKTISFEVANTGNRTVNLVDWGISFDKNFSLQVLDITGKTLPKSLGLEENIRLSADLSGLKKALKENHIKIKSDHNKMKLYISDSTGKKYYVRTNYSPKQILEMSESDTAVVLEA